MQLLFESGVLPVLTDVAGKQGQMVQRYLRLFGKMEVEVQTGRACRAGRLPGD